MGFLLYFGIAFLVSLYALSIKAAILYGILVLLSVTFGKSLVGVIIASGIPHQKRLKHFKKLILLNTLITYAVIILFSLRYNNFLIIPSVLVCLFDFWLLKESLL